MDRPRTGPSSDSPRLSRTSADSFALTGVSQLPDPSTNAYRRDLADVALAGQVIASHFVAPVEHCLVTPAQFRAEPLDAGELLAELNAGDCFRLLECKLGWAWGYAGPGGQVGYVKAEALGLA